MSFQAVMQAAKQARAEKRLDYELAQYKRRAELEEMAQEVDQYVEQFKYKSNGKNQYSKPLEPANKPEDFEGYIPLSKVAGIIKLSGTQLTKMCRQGNLKAKRMRRPNNRTIWYIREDYAHRCAERRRVGANFWWRD